MAYEGFELIANTGEDLSNPARDLPRAFYVAVMFVILLYVAIAVVAVGGVPLGKLIAAKDYALAEAARPVLGQGGFTMIAIAALLSTFSAINATLYGSARLSYTIAKEGELPAELEHQIWGQPLEGLFITAGLALILANAADLNSISTLGSAGFLIIFAAVNAANLRLAKETGAMPLAGRPGRGGLPGRLCGHGLAERERRPGPGLGPGGPVRRGLGFWKGAYRLVGSRGRARKSLVRLRQSTTPRCPSLSVLGVSCAR